MTPRGMRLHDPQDDRVAGKQKTERFPIAVTARIAAEYAAHGPPERSPENQHEGVVEPDYRINARPEDVSYDAVVPIGDPTIARGGRGHPVSKDLIRSLDPSRLPVKRVEFDVRDAHRRRKACGERAFAGAAIADHVDSSHHRGFHARKASHGSFGYNPEFLYYALNQLGRAVSGSMETRLMRLPAVAFRLAAGAFFLLCLLGIGAAAKHAPRRVEIKIEDLKYKPAEIEVGAGDTVVWVNDDDTDHLVKADDGSFNSGRIACGRSFEHKFDKPGKFIYHDDLHPRMKGTITVIE